MCGAIVRTLVASWIGSVVGARPIAIRFEPGLLAEIDRVRGGKTRSEWLRELAEAAVAAQDALGVALSGREAVALGKRDVRAAAYRR